MGKRIKVLFALGFFGRLSCAYPLKIAGKKGAVIPTGMVAEVIHMLPTDSPTG